MVFEIEEFNRVGNRFSLVGKIAIEVFLPAAAVGVAVVIAGDGDPGLFDLFDETGPFFEFLDQRSSGDVSPQQNQVDLQLVEEFRQKGDLLFRELPFACEQPVQVAQNPLRKKSERVPGDMGKMEIGNLSDSQKDLLVRVKYTNIANLETNVLLAISLSVGLWSSQRRAPWFWGTFS